MQKRDGWRMVLLGACLATGLSPSLGCGKKDQDTNARSAAPGAGVDSNKGLGSGSPGPSQEPKPPLIVEPVAGNAPPAVAAAGVLMATGTPAPLGFGADLDELLQSECDEPSIGMTKETLDAKTAALVGYPEGDVGHFHCDLKEGAGAVAWDMMFSGAVPGGVFSLSVYGDAIKPGTRWSVNHFARIGSRFALPFIPAAERQKLEKLVVAYAAKEPEMGTRWELGPVVANLNQVLAGENEGKWVMGLSRVSRP